MFKVGDRVNFNATSALGDHTTNPDRYYIVTEVATLNRHTTNISGRYAPTTEQLIRVKWCFDSTAKDGWELASEFSLVPPLKTYTVTIEAPNEAEARQKLASGNVILTEK